MNWRTDLAAARARLAALEAAEMDLITGKRAAKIAAGGEQIDFAQSKDPLADLRRAIQETQTVIDRLTGARRGGVIIPVMGR